MIEPESPQQLEHNAASSIELRRHSNGNYAWTIKLYFEHDPGTDILFGTDANRAINQLRKIDAILRSQYAPEPLPF